jgi:hypothetical protein
MEAQVLTQVPSNSAKDQQQFKERQLRKRDRSNENLTKRWRTLVKTGRKLHQVYGADIYFSISIPKKHKSLVFRSDEHVSPMLPADLV